MSHCTSLVSWPRIAQSKLFTVPWQKKSNSLITETTNTNFGISTTPTKEEVERAWEVALLGYQVSDQMHTYLLDDAVITAG